MACRLRGHRTRAGNRAVVPPGSRYQRPVVGGAAAADAAGRIRGRPGRPTGASPARRLVAGIIGKPFLSGGRHAEARPGARESPGNPPSAPGKPGITISSHPSTSVPENAAGPVARRPGYLGISRRPGTSAARTGFPAAPATHTSAAQAAFASFLSITLGT